MSSDSETKKLILIPPANLVALACILWFGWNGLAASFVVVMLYHLVYSPKTALLADATLFLTVLPMAQFFVYMYDVSILHALFFLTVGSALSVGIATLARIRVYSFFIGHPIR